MNQDKALTIQKNLEKEKEKKAYLDSLKLKDPEELTKEEATKLKDYLNAKPFISSKTEMDLNNQIVVDGQVIQKKDPEIEKKKDELMNENTLYYEKYFKGETDPLDEKFQSHLRYVDDLNNTGFKEIDKKTTFLNYHEAMMIKDVAESYKNISQSANFYKLSDTYAITQDVMRIDCGLIISRPPIFLK